MVDALLLAAENESMEMKEDFLMMVMDADHQHHHHLHHPVRFCEFCNSSNTPTWRRGPAGKGSLCNACGIKWRLRKRMKTEKRSSSSPSSSPTMMIITKSTSKRRREHLEKHRESGSPKRKKYYCKYCNQTWALSHFRNSQQFGAHCSNCSRRPKDGDEKDYQDDPMDYPDDNERDFKYHHAQDDKYHDRDERYHVPYSPTLSVGDTPSPSSPQTPDTPPQPSHQDGLLLRLLHVVEHQLVDVHELAEIRDELSDLKSELLSREEARHAELKVLQARLNQELAELRGRLEQSVTSHSERTFRRIFEIEQGLRGRVGSGAAANIFQTAL